MKKKNNSTNGLVKHEDAFKALDKIWDSFDRIATKFIPIGKTAQLMWEQKPLEVPFLKIAVKKLDLSPTNLDTLEEWLGIRIDPNATKKQIFEVEGVPVHIFVYSKPYRVLLNVQAFYYSNFPETLWMPNPMEDLHKFKVL